MRTSDRQRVLVVEDNRPTLEMISLVLEDEGYCVTCVRSGAAALLSIENQAPSILLVDLVLPISWGDELIAEVRHRWGHQVPILVVSALQRDDRRLRAGIEYDGWVGKPFRPEQLIEAVQRLLVGRTPGRAAGIGRT